MADKEKYVIKIQGQLVEVSPEVYYAYFHMERQERWQEEKQDELDRVTLKSDTLRKYFPKNYTPQQMEQVIIKLLDQWQKKRQRQNER